MTPRRPTRDEPRGRHGSSSASSSDSGAGGRAGVIVKGLAALLFTLGFIAGVPYLLLRIGAFPTSIPDPSTLWRAATGPDLTGHGVFVVLAALVWVGWAWFTLSVLRETGAAIRSRGRRPTRAPRRVLGRTSRGVQPAGILVAAIVAMFVSAPLLAAGAPPAAAAGHSGAATGTGHGTVATATHNAASGSTSARATSSSAAGSASTSHASTTHQGAGAAAKATSAKSSKQGRAVATTNYTVRRHDTLWTIAEKQLGDPTRYREIVNLNPHLQHDTTIHAGETLKLPQHHTQQSRRPAVTTVTAPQAVVAPQVHGEQVTVQLGDTVSEIAADHGVRDWRTVWDANKGRAEPGGKRFTDPDHIEVGWTLTVPAASKGAVAPPAPAQAASAAPAPEAGDDGATPAETAPVAPQPQTPPAPASAAGVAPGAAVGSTHRQGPLEQQDSLTESGASSPTPTSSVGASVPPATPASPAQPGADRAGAEGRLVSVHARGVPGRRLGPGGRDAGRAGPGEAAAVAGPPAGSHRGGDTAAADPDRAGHRDCGLAVGGRDREGRSGAAPGGCHRHQPAARSGRPADRRGHHRALERTGYPSGALVSDRRTAGTTAHPGQPGGGRWRAGCQRRCVDVPGRAGTRGRWRGSEDRRRDRAVPDAGACRVGRRQCVAAEPGAAGRPRADRGPGPVPGVGSGPVGPDGRECVGRAGYRHHARVRSGARADSPVPASVRTRGAGRCRAGLGDRFRGHHRRLHRRAGRHARRRSPPHRRQRRGLGCARARHRTTGHSATHRTRFRRG